MLICSAAGSSGFEGGLSSGCFGVDGSSAMNGGRGLGCVPSAISGWIAADVGSTGNLWTGGCDAGITAGVVSGVIFPSWAGPASFLMGSSSVIGRLATLSGRSASLDGLVCICPDVGTTGLPGDGATADPAPGRVACSTCLFSSCLRKIFCRRCQTFLSSSDSFSLAGVGSGSGRAGSDMGCGRGTSGFRWTGAAAGGTG